MSNALLKNSYSSSDILKISVTNIQKLRTLIDDIEKKQNELQEAIQKLKVFNLEIRFSTEMGEQYAPQVRENQDPL